MKQKQAKAPAPSAVLTSAAEELSLEERLQIAKDELETVPAERANVKLMMRGILRQARRSVRVAGLGRVYVGEKGMERAIIRHIALGFEKISRRLKALPWAVQELASREGRGLAHAVAEHVLACYRSRDPNFSLEPAREGVVEAEEEATREAVRGIVTEVAACFMWEPPPPTSSGSSSSIEDSSPPPEPADLD